MRISDWSSDVCSSDLRARLRRPVGADRRAVPRAAKRHHRRGAERRCYHGLAGRHLCVWRLLPVLDALQPRPAGAVPAFGLNEIWKEAYDEVEGVEWLSAGAWDPCHIFTKEPIRSLADMNGKRVFGVPTAGRSLARYGLIQIGRASCRARVCQYV